MFVAFSIPLMAGVLALWYWASIHFEPDHAFRFRKIYVLGSGFLIMVPFVIAMNSMKPLRKLMYQALELEISDAGEVKLYEIHEGNRSLVKSLGASQMAWFMFHQVKVGYFFATKDQQGVPSFDLFLPVSKANEKNFLAFHEAYRRQFAVSKEEIGSYRGNKVKWQASSVA